MKRAKHPSGRHIIFEESNHVYYVEDEPGMKFVSGTTFIKRWFPKFDKEAISAAYAAKRGLSQSEVLKSWDDKGRVARENGTEVHKYLEDLFDKKSPVFSSNDKVKNMQIMSKNAWREIKDTYIPLESECIFASIGDRIAGMADLICKNKKTGKLAILDYKTNAVLKTENPFQKAFAPISHMDDCNFNHYILQLNLYRHIAEKEGYGKYEEMKLVHITDRQYKLVDTPYCDMNPLMA
jgi:ATP-dependent exoDNAse (exonuclease V) beta subunit